MDSSIPHLEPDGPFVVQLTAELLTWPGVSAEPHRFGGVEFRYGRKELGHIHGSRVADLPLPRAVRDEVVADGRAQPHRIMPYSGWVSFPISGPGDMRPLLDLFALAYEIAVAEQTPRFSRPPQALAQA
jgi:Luciferase